MKWNMLSNSEQSLTKVSVALFIVAAVVWMGVFVAPLLGTKETKKKSGVVWAKPAPGEAEARWAGINVLRDRIRPWAQKNQDIIRQMREGDEKAVKTVYDAIPSDVREIGMRGEDMMGFTWNCHADKAVGEHIQKSDSVTAGRLQSSIDIDRYMLDFHREKYKDIALADSVMPGQISYTLWASGRITRGTRVGKCKTTQECLSQREHTEVVSAFEFVGRVARFPPSATR